jgi:hypothetical protein
MALRVAWTSQFTPFGQMSAPPLDAQPPEVQETFQFPLATAMHEAGKFELGSGAEVDEQRSEKLIMLDRFDTLTHRSCSQWR